MWGSGGRFYWGRKERGAQGIAVLFGWSSSGEKSLDPFIDLYGSNGWDSLVCRADFLTLFSQEKAATLASQVLNELVKEIKIRQLPVVLISFSGGSKGCLYKVLQLLEGECEGQLCQDEYLLVRDCICGQVYDSSPVDFTSDLGSRFPLHFSILNRPHPPRVISWMAKAFASGVDTLFPHRFEGHRSEYWQTLYSSANMGPFLILCSEGDKIASYQIVCNFAQNLQDLGGDVKLVKWNNSPHLAHFEYYQADYTAAVSEFLTKVSVIYSTRRELNEETSASSSTTSKSVRNLKEPESTSSSPDNLNRVVIDPNDHFLPNSMEFSGTREADSLADQKADLFHLPAINPHGVLSQILFDVCVPRNVECWDIKPSTSLNGRQTLAFGRRHGAFNPMKRIRRSRL